MALSIVYFMFRLSRICSTPSFSLVLLFLTLERVVSIPFDGQFFLSICRHSFGDAVTIIIFSSMQLFGRYYLQVLAYGLFFRGNACNWLGQHSLQYCQ